MAIYSWANASGGNWNDPSNWNLDNGMVPGPGDAADLDALGSFYTVTADVTIDVGSIDISDLDEALDLSTPGQTNTVSGDFDNGGYLDIDYETNSTGTTLDIGGTLTNSGYVYIAFGSTETSSTTVTAASLDNTGYMFVDRGSSVTITGDADNSGQLYVGAYVSDGSSLTIGGTLTNSDYMVIGDGGSGTSPTTVSATGLDNTANGEISIDGGSNPGTADQATLNIADAAPGTLDGVFTLFGDALLEFGGGTITAIASDGHLFLDGPDAFVADAGATTSNSALDLASNAGYLLLENDETLTSTGDFDNSGSGILHFDDSGGGGSTFTIDGTLTNSGQIYIGNPTQTERTTVTAADLVNTGGITLDGGLAGVTLDITGAAPATLDGVVNLTGDSLLEFASSQITGIATGAELALNGPDAFVADAGTLTSNSALDLASNAGYLYLENGAAVTSTGDFDNTGYLNVDGYGNGGSTLTIGGALTNSDSIAIGALGSETSPTTVSAASLDNTASGEISIDGGSSSGTSDLATLSIASAAPGTLDGAFSLFGNALLEFGSGTITAIASDGHLFLDGPDAFVADAGATTSNSALDLASNAGYLLLENDETLTSTGDFDNSGSGILHFDDSGSGGSTFTIDGTLTNSAQAYIGNPTQTASTTITAADLDNTGLIDLDGGSNSGTLDQVLLDITGAGTLDGSLTLSGDSLAEFGGGLDIGNTDQGSVDVGSGSTLEVTGALDVGNGAFGLVTVTDGGSVDVDGSGVAVADVGFISTGSVDVTGAGASFAVTGDNNDGLIIGDDSDGVFDVEDGASVSASSDDADPFYAVVLGNQADGAGTLTVDGSGSSFTAGSGGLAVGLVGTGYVTVSEGATLTVDGSKSLLGIGAASTVDVTGPGSELTLGTGVGLNINSTGSLMVDAGGSVSIVDELVIGASGSGTGSVDVDGGFVTDDGLLNVGGAETGALSIEGGGTVSVGYELILGDNSSAPTEGSGTITQTGGLLQIDSGGTFYLSDYGNGEYDLDGGTLEIGGDSLFANDDDGTGTFNLGGGTIAVTGSELTTDANITLTADTTSVLNVGTLGADFTGKVSGSGNLDITGSGVASFADLSTTGDVDLDDATLNIGSTLATVGQLDGTGGTVEIGTNGALVEGDGTDSTFSGAITGTNFNTDTVAKVGSDTLTLNNVTATGVQILAYQGNVAITGTDSLSYLAIGEGPGTATASIGDGASLTINGINGAGHAGALQVGDFGGTGTFDQTGGTVTITGNNALNVGNQGGTGTYDLEGGQLVLGAIDDIGRNTPTTSDPNGTPASHGTIYISGTGVLEVASGGELILGSDASTTVGESSGTITQTGGTLEIDSGGALYLSAYGNGEYDLDGGTLELGGSSSLFANYNDHGGTGTFKLGGGTIAVTGSELTTDADITLTSGTTSTLNVGTLGADFTGKVSGAGNLDITGSGVASFADLSTTGDLDLDGATLDIASLSLSGGELSGDGVVNGAVTIGSGGEVTLDSGTLEFASGGVVNNNQITVDGATLDLDDGVDLSGIGTVDISNGGYVDLNGTVSSGQTFIVDPSTIEIGDPADFAGTLDLSGGDVLLVDGATGGTYANGAFTFDLPSGDVTISAPGYSSSDFSFTSNNGTLEVQDTQNPCYCRGTLILTELGEQPVEDLKIGDLVATRTGLRPIKWIGTRAYDPRFIRGQKSVLPIVVSAGALAHGVPARDLWVSPEHALYIDSALVPARLLVNGMTINQVEAVEHLEYFHIELDSHDVILAEGTPAETYIECDNRLMFHNAAEFPALYPEALPNTGQFCAPRLEEGAATLTAIRERFLARAAALGHQTTDDPGLHLVVDGVAVEPLAIEGAVYRFALSQVPAAIHLASRSTVPAETDAAARDRRRLGVCLRRITLRDPDLTLDLLPHIPQLRDGFHEAEGAHRWTGGLAQLPASVLDLFTGPLDIEIATWPSQLRYIDRAA